MLVNLVVDTSGDRPRVVSVSELSWWQRLLLRTQDQNESSRPTVNAMVQDTFLRSVPSPLVIEASGLLARRLAASVYGLQLPCCSEMKVAIRPEPHEYSWEPHPADRRATVG